METNEKHFERENKIPRQSFGAAEFKVVCHPDKVQLIIHNNHIVAEAHKDVYNTAFEFMVMLLGGRIDEKKPKQKRNKSPV
jgi:hypothetical protein